MELLLLNAALATLLAAVVAAAAAVVRRPAFASRAWLLVLAKFVVPPLVLVPLIRPAANVGTGGTVDPIGVGAARLEIVPAAPPDPPPMDDVNTEPTSPPPTDETVVAEAPPRWSWPALGLAAWVCGSCAYWSLTAVRLARFRRVARTAEDATPEVADDLAAAADAIGVRRPVRVRWLDAAVSPFALGRSTVFLPLGLWSQLDHGGRVAVLAHELAHLARGDAWVRRLELLAVGLYWWLPVAWWARRMRRRAEEACCDERVVRALPHLAGDYASALVEAAAYVSRPLAVPLACGGAARGSELRRRVTMILTPTTKGRPWAAAVLLIGLAALALPLRPGWADDDPPPVPPAPPAPPSVPAPPTPPTPPTPPALPEKVVAAKEPAPAKVSAVDLRDLRDEIELLEAQLAANAAKLDSLKKLLAVAREERAMFEKLRERGQLSESEVRKAVAQTTKAESEVVDAEHLVRLTDIKLRQAKRRLGEATPAVVPPAAVKPVLTVSPLTKLKTPSVSRTDIERRIDQLQKELDELKALLKTRPNGPAR